MEERGRKREKQGLTHTNLIGLVPILDAPSPGVQDGLDEEEVGDGVADGLVGHVHEQLKLLGGLVLLALVANQLMGVI